jgi:hypothetical protein
MGINGQFQIIMQHIEAAYPEVLRGFLVSINALPTLEFCSMASDRSNDANSLILAVQGSRLWGKLIGVCVPEKCQCLPLGNNQVPFVEYFQIQFD